MDPINPIAGNPDALNQNPVAPQSPKDPHGITIAAMAIFVLLALGAIAFLYYQNQQLKTLLISYQTVQMSPIPTSIVTETPQATGTASPSATPKTKTPPSSTSSPSATPVSAY